LDHKTVSNWISLLQQRQKDFVVRFKMYKRGEKTLIQHMDTKKRDKKPTPTLQNGHKVKIVF
jgi:hypothetical protein